MPKRWGFRLLNFEYENSKDQHKGVRSLIERSFLPDGYEEYLSQQLASSREDFNSAMNWAITSLGIILGLILTSTSFPNFTSWILTIGLILICTHFATRSARSYLNILRWALILRKVTQLEVARLEGVTDSDLTILKNDTIGALKTYHINWASPLSKKELISKILLEFGFGYFYLILFGLLVWIATSVAFSNQYIYAGIVGIALMFWEWSILFRSLYLKRIVTSTDTNFIAHGIQE